MTGNLRSVVGCGVIHQIESDDRRIRQIGQIGRIGTDLASESDQSGNGCPLVSGAK